MISARSELEHFGNFRLCGHSDNRKHLMIKRIKVTVTVLETLKAVHQTVQDDYYSRRACIVPICIFILQIIVLKQETLEKTPENSDLHQARAGKRQSACKPLRFAASFCLFLCVSSHGSPRRTQAH